MISGGSAQRTADSSVLSDRSRIVAAGLAMFGFGLLLFALDLATPLGVADGIGYPPVLTITLFLSSRRSTIVAALIFSALIIVGQLFGVGA